jgi:hypothetical protein
VPAPKNWTPNISVYSLPATPPAATRTKLKDLSDRGQQALIEALSRDGVDAAALKKSLAGTLEPKIPQTVDDRTGIDRTLVISITKPIDAPLGDRLVRTIVTISPQLGYEFSGYTIAKTEFVTLDVAHLEDESERSLGVTLAPPIKGFGDNSVEGKLSSKSTTSADISAQYEKLGIDIQPGQLTVVRDSERGLDVQGNTLIDLTLVPRPGAMVATALVATDFVGNSGGTVLTAKEGALEVTPLRYLGACPITAVVSLQYLMRQIVTGREYYTEGKQTVTLTSNTTGGTYTLVRATETQPALYQIDAMIGKVLRGGLMVRRKNGQKMQLVFDDFDQATAFAKWIKGNAGQEIGADKNVATTGDTELDAAATFRASRVNLGCTG